MQLVLTPRRHTAAATRREAIAALAREVIAANTALGSALSNASPELQERIPGRHNSRLGLFKYGAAALAQIAKALLIFLSKSELLTASSRESLREDTNFAYLIVSASCVILDSASWACTPLGTTPIAIQLASLHNEAVQELLYTLINMDMGQAPALRGLRATTCSPAAIMGCIERLFAENGRDPSHGEAGGCPWPLE